jgi:hypothetical protein
LDWAYLDLASGAGDSLDADTVVGVDDLGVGDRDGVDDVVVAAADGADGETDGGAGDGDLGRVTDVEGVGVVAALGVTVLVVDGDAVDLEALGVVDAENLNRAVLDRLGWNVSVCTVR